MSAAGLTRTRRRWVVNAVLAVAVLAVAGASVWMLYRPAEATASAAVRTVTVSTGSVTSTVSADGTVEPVREVVANFATSGTIASIRVSVGDTVRKGDRLATLERASARRTLKVAQASLTAAQANLASAQASLDSAEAGTTTTDPTTGTSTTTASESQVAQAEAQVSSAQIQVLQAESDVDDASDALAATTLRAPISGTVLEVNGTVSSASGSSSGSGGTAVSGSTASGSTSDFIVIANLSRMQVAVSFSEADVAGLKVGQKAGITFPALTDITAKGTITGIDPVGTVSSSVVTFGVTVRLTTTPAQVRVGQSASVTVTTGSASNVLVVPSVTVTTTGNRSTVTVLRDGQQAVVPVTLGVEGAAMTQIASGLSEGDQVVLTSATSTSSSSSDDSGFPGGGFPAGGLPGGGGAPAAPPGGLGR